MDKQRVLIVCTGNSCRSQMAEGLVNHFLGEEWEAFSAGSAPAGRVNSLAIQAMAELDIDISTGVPESIEQYRERELDLVITVCDNAAKHCPVWLGQGEVVHMPFDDPADATGSEADKMAIFQQIRDQIRAQLITYLQGQQ